MQASITVATVTVARKIFTVARKKFYGVAQCRVYSPRVGIFAPQFQITGYIGTLLEKKGGCRGRGERSAEKKVIAGEGVRIVRKKKVVARVGGRIVGEKKGGCRGRGEGSSEKRWLVVWLGTSRVHTYVQKHLKYYAQGQ